VRKAEPNILWRIDKAGLAERADRKAQRLGGATETVGKHKPGACMRGDEPAAILVEHEACRAITLIAIEQIDGAVDRVVEAEPDDVNEVGTTFDTFEVLAAPRVARGCDRAGSKYCQRSHQETGRAVVATCQSALLAPEELR
jgi:hypothetical protein